MLPPGSEVVLGRRTRVLAHGTALIGGTPTRLVRLTPRARPLLDGRRIRVDSPASAVLADRLLEVGLVEPDITTLTAPPGAEVTYVVPILIEPRTRRWILATGASPWFSIGIPS